MSDPDARPLLTGKLNHKHLVALDVIAAFTLSGTAAGNLAAGSWGPGVGLPAWVAWVSALLIGIPSMTRRFRPLTSLWASLFYSLLCVLTGALEVVFFAMVLPMHTVASREPRNRSLPALAVTLVFTFVTNSVPVRPMTLAGIVLSWTLLCSVWLLGRASRERRQLAAIAAEQKAREAVIGERLRIARELHDVVAHNMSMVAVKAGVAHHVAEQHPAEAKETLGIIESTTRDALVEMRHLLGVLRSEQEQGTELSPAPGLSGLVELAERARSTGVEVELSVDVKEPLPEGVELSVYRIVQESVTNVMKHAAPARCTVSVRSESGSVHVGVRDDGSRITWGAQGHGLLGMRERVAVYGGTFSAGPVEGGGFAVSAVLPHG
ncbi:sensor histidine kinase [Prauserella marina]|uniref:sensor histidine kinase n=1 Tax=Prauserella marina TaxID=530584 RepID=UPI001472CC1C|nr:sensor histidine kinase [Prauserella marina]